jgi:hypothetical protein
MDCGRIAGQQTVRGHSFQFRSCRFL